MWDRETLLRPHHGLCLAYFIGEGYSGAFAENMGRELRRLTERNPMVCLRCGADVICAACPERQGDACWKEEQVEGYDRAVLVRCGLQEGVALPFLTFAKLVQESIIALGRRSEICGHCQWESLCDRVKSRWADAAPRQMET